MHVLDSYNDEQLFCLLQTGSEEAFNAIFNRYNKRLLIEAYARLQNEEEAHDIVQDVYMWLWNKKDSLKVPDNLKAYLAQVVRFKCVDLIRKKTYNRAQKAHYTIIAETSTHFTAIETRELGHELNTAIAMVTPASRLAFEQLYVHKKSLKEIADHMNINVQSVKNHIHRALKSLRENLKHSLS